MKNATEDEVVAIATAYCIDMKIEDELVCTAVVLEFKVLVHVGIVRRLWTLSPSPACTAYGTMDCTTCTYVANSPLRPFVLHEY